MAESATSQTKPSSPELTSRTKNGMHRVADTAASMGQEAATHYVAEPAKDIFELLRDYAREKPDVAAMWAFGLGIVVGWKLRP